MEEKTPGSVCRERGTREAAVLKCFGWVACAPSFGLHEVSKDMLLR